MPTYGRPEMGIGLHWVGVTGSFEPPHGCWELNSCPFLEHYSLLTTEQSPLPLVIVCSMCFIHIHCLVWVKTGDQLCGLYQHEVPGSFLYDTIFMKTLSMRKSIWGHMGAHLVHFCGSFLWNSSDSKKRSLGFTRLPKGTKAQDNLLGMLPSISIYSWVPLMQGWAREGYTCLPQCRHTENPVYTQEYLLEPDGCMFKIVDVKEPAQKHIQTRMKNKIRPSVIVFSATA